MFSHFLERSTHTVVDTYSLVKKNHLCVPVFSLSDLRPPPLLIGDGHWIAENPDAPPPGHHGFHLSSFYSPFVSFGDIAVEFVKAQASVIKSEALRKFTNSWLAEPWEEQALIRTKSGRYQWKELPEDHYNDCLKLCLFTTWKFLRPPEYAGEDSVSANPAAN